MKRTNWHLCTAVVLVAATVGLQLKAEDYRSESQEVAIYPIRALQVFDNLPIKVRMLVGLCGRESLPHPIQTDENYWVRRARADSVEWIEKVIGKNLLPENVDALASELQMWQAGNGDGSAIDVTYAKWTKGRYQITVLQTMTVFTVIVQPQRIESANHDRPANVEEVEQLAAQMIHDISEVKAFTNKGITNIVPNGTRSVLINKLFAQGLVKECEDGFVGVPTAIDHLDENEMAARMHWWRLCSWWSKGTQVGFYTLKTEGGAWRPNYAAIMDETWFAGPTCTRKSRPASQNAAQ